MITGKWLILGIFGLAFVAAAAAWVHRYYRTDFVRDRFGTAALQLVESSPQVEAIARYGETESGRKDVTRAPGMLNIRHMLGSDFSYPEQEPQEMTLPTQWDLIFQDGQKSVTLGFHHDCKAVMLKEGGATATINDAAAQHLRAFFAEQFPQESESMNRHWKVAK